MEDVIEDLENLVLDNRDLEQLEALLGDFNPFVAMRWTRQELRHSAFLRWLMDPRETHGLGSYFLRLFFKEIAAKVDAPASLSPSVIDVDSSDYGEAVVTQEWNNIDLLVRDDVAKFVGVVENKVGSGEHSGQLQRYREIVEKQFPDHSKLFAFLTVDGKAPSDDAYVPVSYGKIADLIADTLDRRQDQLSDDVRSFLQHYIEMLRRHIVEDSAIQEICQRIYRTHRRALDVLFEHRPDRVLEITEFLQGLVEDSPLLDPDHGSKSYVRFAPKSLGFLPREGEGWTKSKRLIVFELDQSAANLKLKVVLGPGQQQLRDLLHKWIIEQGAVFNRAGTKLYPQWWSFHLENWLGKKQHEESELDDLKEKLKTRFEHFLEETLPQMTDAFEQLERKDFVRERVSPAP